MAGVDEEEALLLVHNGECMMAQRLGIFCAIGLAAMAADLPAALAAVARLRELCWYCADVREYLRFELLPLLRRCGADEAAAVARRLAKYETANGEAVPTTHLVLPAPVAVRTPPTLAELCVAVIADNATHLVDLSGTDLVSCASILTAVLDRGKLTFDIAHVFLKAGHDEIKAALQGLDLLAGVVGPPRMGGGGGGGGPGRGSRYYPGGSR